MNKNIDNKNKISAKLFIISFFVIILTSCLQINKGFNLGDEGFLWYGVQRVIVGEVPIRDFMAYDPGRYYWSASLMGVLGDDGIISLRIAVAIFQVFGLFVGVLLIAQSSKKQGNNDLLFWLVSAAVLVIWMFPRHKLFDISLSIFLIGTLTYLIYNPTPRRYFVAGLCVGLVAVFGRNHGIYGVIASLGVMLWLNLNMSSGTSFFKGVSLWGGGIVVGFVPIILMAFMIPGFALAFWESILFLFEQKATNIKLPVPWPWVVNVEGLSSINLVREILVGIFFVAILVFGALGILWVLHQKVKGKYVAPAVVASVFLGLPYAHFSFSRADVAHLAQGIFPFLVGGLALLSSKEARIKWPIVTMLFGASVWVMLMLHPVWKCRVDSHCVNVKVSDNNLLVTPRTANNISLIRELETQYAPDGQSFIVTPFWPGAYPLLEQRSPMWEIYALFPRTEEFQEKEIRRIRASNPSFILILDVPLDGRDELRFSNTHPLIHQFIVDNFEPVPESPNPAFQIYKAKSTY